MSLKDRIRSMFVTDPNSGLQAEVVVAGGRARLATDSNISSVNVPLGKDPIPDTWFKILTAGAIGDTVRVQIAATNNDSTTPDRDLPAVDVTYTLVAADVGNERKLAENIVNALEANANFKNALFEADVIDGDKRAVIHISCVEFSMNGEFHERPLVGDFSVTTTGSTQVLVETDYQRIVSRAKEVSLGRDPRNPHRLGVQTISGTVIVRADDVSVLIEEFATTATLLKSLAVDGSSTPVVFNITANPAGGDNKVIEVLKMYGTDTNIKVGETNFLGGNSALANGILIQIIKDNVTSQFRVLKTTNDILARMASSPEKNKIINQSGGDFIEAVFDLVDRNTQLVLKAGTTDSIKVTVRDNLSPRNSLFFVAEGFLREP